MAEIRNRERLSEVEFCLNSYFHTHIAPVMKVVRDDLQHKQAQEIADYQFSFAGIMSTLASGSNAAGSMMANPLDTLQYTGEHCSKTVEDYVEMVAEKLGANTALQDDLIRLAAEWREAVVAEVGRARYDEISATLGADLAVAYVDYRMEQMMIDKMVYDQMPKSSFDYILKTGAENSLLGLAQTMNKSPLQAEIEARGVAAYKPTSGEKWGARGVSMASDIIMTGGVYSWGGLARWAGMEVCFAGLEKYLEGKQSNNDMTVEQCISSALWGTTQNQFAGLRNGLWKMKTYEHPYLHEVNDRLSKKLPFCKEKPFWEIEPLDFNKPFHFTKPFDFSSTSFSKPFNFGLSSVGTTPQKSTPAPKVPLVIKPGYEQEYLDWLQKQKTQTLSMDQNDPNLIGPPRPGNLATPNLSLSSVAGETTAAETTTETSQTVTQQTEDNGNESAWQGLLQSFGLDNLGDIGRNLPYVIATLPDMLVGLFTGKTNSVNLKKDMIPMASILLGLFVKNPLLKLALIGMGGANLLNKMGHESLDRRMGLDDESQIQHRQAQYMQYHDEPLNPRIVNPVIQGTTLVATIDGIPCTVTIPANAADAYVVGTLPLNTLCNAILVRNDQMQALARENYHNAEIEQTVERQRGIGLR